MAPEESGAVAPGRMRRYLDQPYVQELLHIESVITGLKELCGPHTALPEDLQDRVLDLYVGAARLRRHIIRLQRDTTNPSSLPSVSTHLQQEGG